MNDTQEAQPRINPAYIKYDTMTPEQLVTAMAALEAEKDRLAEILKSINGEYDYLRLIKIPTVWDERKIVIIKVTDIGRCNLTADIYASIKAGKKDEAYQWMRDTGREGLIQDAVNASTLKASIKASLKKGESWPDELFNVTPFTRASITKT